MENEIKILAFASRYSGCSYHRVVLPLQTMGGVKADVTNKIEAIVPDKYDLFFFNRLNHIADGNLDEIRERFGCKIVVDVDDWWELPYDHIYYDAYRKDIGAKIEANVRQADLVFTSTEKLAERIRPFNSRVIYVPNALPYGQGQFNDYKEPSDVVRLFWCGGSTHEPDIEILKNPLKRLKAHGKDFRMILGGYSSGNEVEKDIWDMISRNYTDNFNLPFEIYPGTTPDKYMELYDKADICLIPLRDNEWNGYKSNLKILEAACKKAAVVVSDVYPYREDRDAPVLWVRNQSDWYNHIKKLIYDRKYREELGERLSSWAKEKYNLERSNAVRSAAFRDLTEAPVDLR